MSIHSHQLLGKLNKRAQSLDERGDHHRKQGSQLPSILTPTFGDWKISDLNNQRADIDVAHPKISRKNPLYDKFSLNEIQRRTPASSSHDSSVNDIQPLSLKQSQVYPFRDLRSEGQTQRQQFKENYGDQSSQGKRYNSTGKNNRCQILDDQNSTKSTKSNNIFKQLDEIINYQSAQKVFSKQNSDEESPSQQQPYQNLNTNKFIKIPKRQLKQYNQQETRLTIMPVKQTSPMSLRSAESKPMNNLYWNQQTFSQRKTPLQDNEMSRQVGILIYIKVRVETQQQKIEQLRMQLAGFDEENMMKAEIIFNQCCSMLDQQKAVYENVLKNNSLFYKYTKINKQEIIKQKTMLRLHFEKIYLK